MKKRIGSKIYNTETAKLIAYTDDLMIYQKQGYPFDLYKIDDMDNITDLSLSDFKDICKDPAIRILSEIRTAPADRSFLSITLDRETHARIKQAAEAKNISMADYIRQKIDD